MLRFVIVSSTMHPMPQNLIPEEAQQVCLDFMIFFFFGPR